MFILKLGKASFLSLLYLILRREQFLQWSEGLPDYQSPSWLGLPNNAEKVILTSLGMFAILNG